MMRSNRRWAISIASSSGMFQLEVQIGDQLGAVCRVGIVEFVADFALAFGGLFQQGDGAGRVPSSDLSIRPWRWNRT